MTSPSPGLHQVQRTTIENFEATWGQRKSELQGDQKESSIGEKEHDSDMGCCDNMAGWRARLHT